MSGWTCPSSPDAAGLTVSTELHANTGVDAEVNTNALTPMTTATTTSAISGVRNRSNVDCCSWWRRWVARRPARGVPDGPEDGLRVDDLPVVALPAGRLLESVKGVLRGVRRRSGRRSPSGAARSGRRSAKGSGYAVRAPSAVGAARRAGAGRRRTRLRLAQPGPRVGSGEAEEEEAGERGREQREHRLRG